MTFIVCWKAPLSLFILQRTSSSQQYVMSYAILLAGAWSGPNALRAKQHSPPCDVSEGISWPASFSSTVKYPLFASTVEKILPLPRNLIYLFKCGVAYASLFLTAFRRR